MDALIDYTERLVRQEIATWPDGTRLLHRLSRLGRRRRPRRADHGARDDRRRRGDGRPDRLVADGARLAEQHALLRPGLRLPGGARGADRRGPEHGRRVPAHPHPLTRPGTVAEVVMPGASSMRGVTGFRVVDAVCGALAQLLPERVAAAGEGGNTLAIFGAERPDGGSLHLLRADRRHVGRDAGGRRQRRPDEPREPRREHSRRGRRVGVPDRGRAVRARTRLGRRRPAPRRARDRAGLALPHPTAPR